ncbi:MAG: eukaryotic-like serine/threonine-protein kinase [Gemmatimonadaceae bacterium]|jgi:serine/threonine-protein kinase|nr:eukaryotic-like serine/threonine-protein kinase [Gemmatimonadaceae bacterium]
MPISPTDDLGTHVATVLSANYELESEIGRGGMGIVYSARDKRLKREIAVKVLPPELSFRADIRQRFLREAETAAQLNHPNIVPIYTVEERENLVYFVMAYIKGDNLGQRLQQHGPIPPVEVRRILREVADALAYAHHRNVIHRDIKPDNIIIDEETGRAMVTDFGIARALTDSGDSRLTATGMAIGTPAYMSPEQSAGDQAIDGRSDLYSLGVVGYQMLCGQPPFVASNTPSMLVKHLSEKPIPVDERWPDLPPDLSRAVMMCLEKDPADRFPSAAAFAVALDGGGMPTLATRASTAAASSQARAQTREREVTEALRDRYTPAAPTSYSPSAPTPEEMSKWNAPMVVSFRRKMAPYLAVNAILVPISLFSNHDFIAVTVIWTVALAFKYSKLWAAGYDWRDVFRQPRDRLMFDVAAETIDDARALFDDKKRAQVRARARSRGQGMFSPMSPLPSMQPFQPYPRVNAPGGGATLSPIPAGPPGAFADSRYGSAIREAESDHREIHRQLLNMPSDEREQIPEVATSADAVFRKVQQLALSLSDMDRGAGRESPEAVEKEISTLESQANPLDYGASEGRVRRLAMLRRQRRALADVGRKKQEAQTKLDNCRQLLRSMRLELVRFRTGGLNAQPTGLTMVTQQAQSVVRDIGYLSDANAELNAL